MQWSNPNVNSTLKIMKNLTLTNCEMFEFRFLVNLTLPKLPKIFNICISKELSLQWWPSQFDSWIGLFIFGSLYNCMLFGNLKLLPCKEESCQISWWLKVKVLTLACHFAILNSQLSLWQSNNGKFPRGNIFHPSNHHTYALQLINQVCRHHITLKWNVV